MRILNAVVFLLLPLGPVAVAQEKVTPDDPDPFEAKVEQSLKSQGAYVIRDKQGPAHFIREIINVNDISDAELRSLSRLKHLHTLQLGNAVDAKVKVAAELSQLRQVCIGGGGGFTPR